MPSCRFQLKARLLQLLYNKYYDWGELDAMQTQTDDRAQDVWALIRLGFPLV